ncbi:MAG TPA: glycoside hydrolase family 3 C-terminal domain-containing protein [Rhodanobacteraceae bacterium]
MSRLVCTVPLFGVAALASMLSAPALAATPSTTSSTAAQCPWVTSRKPVAQRVEQLLGKMTLDQKLSQLHGMSDGRTGYAGQLPAIPSLCIPSLTLQDGPAGAGDGFTGVTQLPAPVALAATWDTKLAEQYGAVVGAEQWGKGVMVDLGPTINIVRDPRWGRAFESYSEDPFLNGYIGAGYINGLQSQGVMAEVKHWAMYNQETYRNTPLDNIDIDERTMQELYFPAFQTLIDKSHPASIMCSYAFINGTDACEDPLLLTQVLRNQFHYKGFAVSDWGGTHSTVAAAKAGLNIEMPTGIHYGAALKKAVQDGKVDTATIDNLLRPILAEMFRFHLFTHAPTGNTHSVVTTPAHARTAEKIAAASAVLLKNADHVLPLSANKVHSIALIGVGAGDSALTAGGGSARVNADAIVSPLAGISQRVGGKISIHYAQGNVPTAAPPMVPTRYLTPASGQGHGLTEQLYANSDLTGSPAVTRTVPFVHYQMWGRSPARQLTPGKWSAKFSGTLRPPVSGKYTFALTSAGRAHLYVDGKLVIAREPFSDSSKTGAITLAANHPVKIELEYYAPGNPGLLGILKPSLRLGWKVPVPGDTWPRQKALLQQAVKTAKAADVAVVFVSKFETEGADLTSISLPDDENRLIAAVAKANPDTIVVINSGSAVTMPWLDQVKGVIEAWYPGQEDGKAIASVLFGDVNPSGKLPVTFPRSLADGPTSTEQRWPGANGKTTYSEALEVGYKWYDARHVKPLFPFGYGLSYTTFKFSHLTVSPNTITPSGEVKVSVDVTNTGSRGGAEVAQLYVGDPAATGEPPRQLRGFRKVYVQPGQTRHVSFIVPAHAFATWNAHTHAWQVASGDYRILVGDSSAHLPVQASVHIAQP